MKTIAITFGGRKCTLEILFYYITKYKKYINEYYIYIATHIQTDIDYMETFALENSDFVKTIYIKDKNGQIINDKKTIWDFAYTQCQDETAVYLKFDDDIIYFDETLFTDFLKYRLENPDIPLLFPTIINNIYFSWLFEKRKIFIPEHKSQIGDTWINTYSRIKDTINQQKSDKSLKIGQLINTDDILCPNAWGNLDYCTTLHRQFITDLKKNDIEKYKTGIFNLVNKELVSISCCSWLGVTLKKITEQVGNIFDDEPWLCIWMPTWLNISNSVYGNCIVAHYAYYRQRELGLDKTDILDKYKNFMFI